MSEPRVIKLQRSNKWSWFTDTGAWGIASTRGRAIQAGRRAIAKAEAKAGLKAYPS